jgi:porin
MRRFFLAFFASMLIWATAAGAQEKTANKAPAVDPLAAVKTDKGLISITKAAHGLTPVSDYTGDLWNRSTALDNIFGRQKLYERGITIDAEVTQVVQGVAGGGPDQIPGTRYSGLAEYGITLDTGKLGLWSGGLLVANAMKSWGKSLLGSAGNLSPTNYLAVWPNPIQNDTVLMEYYFVQTLPGNISLIAGRINAANFIDKNRFANDPRNQFLNLSMDLDPLFGSFISFSTYAVLLDIPVGKHFRIQPAVWDPNDQPGYYGGTNGFFDEVGLGVQLEISWKLGRNLDGAVRPGFYYTTKNTVDFSNPRLVLDVITRQPPPEKPDNYLFSFNFEQYLWKPDLSAGKPKPVRTAAYDFQERGVGVFFRGGFAPEDRNPFNIYLSGGVGVRGVFPSRPYDRFGLGVYWLKESGNLGANLAGQLLRDEFGFEAFYNVALTPWLTLSGDLQWIKSGIAKVNNPVVLGLRLNTQF